MARVLMVTRPLECPAELCRFLDAVAELSLDHTVRVCLVSTCPRLQMECKRMEIDVHVVPSRGMFDVAFLVHLHLLMSGGIADEFHIWDGAIQLETLAVVRLSARPVTVYENTRRTFGFRDSSAYALSQGFDRVAMRDSSSKLYLSNQLAESPESGDLIRNLGIPSGAFVAGVGARMAHGHGMKDAIWSVDLIKNVRDDLHLVILGAGPLAWRLKRFARQCRVEERVHFVGENVGIAEFLRSIDCLWLSGHKAGDLRIAEYCVKQGVPIVASDLAAHRKMIAHDETGLIYPVGARRGLAGQTYRLLKSPELIDRLVNVAREKLNAEGRINAQGHENTTSAARVA
ncbi:MAG: glycosyltransferase [Planctomycetota bacterium]